LQPPAQLLRVFYQSSHSYPNLLYNGGLSKNQDFRFPKGLWGGAVTEGGIFSKNRHWRKSRMKREEDPDILGPETLNCPRPVVGL
jgi:hypothetical protein